MDIKAKIKQLPHSPGTYLMKSKKGNVLYVGKATSLKKRVSSYFGRKVSLKTEMFLADVADIDYIKCDSPEQALILEAALIKEKKPRYNIALRDSKTYPYLELSREKFARFFISRPRKKEEKILFGPYPQAQILRSALKLIRRIFPYRSCRKMPKTACLYFHLKLCPAPCEQRISYSDYKAIVDNI